MTHLPRQRVGWKWWRMGLWVVVGLMALLPSISFAQAHPWEKKVVEICVPLGVPKPLALAFIDLESKGNPFAVNIAVKGAHEGFLPQNRKQAHDLLDNALRQNQNIAIGLMQISYRHHRGAMKSNPHRFFDADTNLAYGCQYLAHLLREPGPLWQRLGRYYAASDVTLQQAYAKRVLKRMVRYLHPQNRRVTR